MTDRSSGLSVRWSLRRSWSKYMVCRVERERNRVETAMTISRSRRPRRPALSLSGHDRMTVDAFSSITPSS